MDKEYNDKKENQYGKFFVVATPIGNMEDITLRAIRILKEVDIILCEDTRTTGYLLKKHDIQGKMISYHSKSSIKKHDDIISILENGQSVALVSDAGTPCISDPGVMIVEKIQKELGSQVEIIAIPGPSAVLSALSVSGIQSSEFTFLGFIPHKKGRQTIFEEISNSKRTIAFYESPHRLIKTLTSLKEILDHQRSVAVSRELTKIFESTIKGNIDYIFDYFTKNKDKVRGEFVIIISGKITK